MKKNYLLATCLLSFMLFSTSNMAAVTPVTLLTIKSDTKPSEILVYTETLANVLDPRSIWPHFYYKAILDTLKKDVSSAGIGVSDFKFKADSMSLDPMSDFKSALQANKAQYTLIITAKNIIKEPALSFRLTVSLYENKKERNVYQGDFFFNQSTGSPSQDDMENLGHQVYAALKDSLGLGLPSTPLPDMTAENKQMCLELARTMSDSTQIRTPGKMSIGKTLTESCPGVAFECFNYASKPEKNNCTMVPPDSKGGILKTYSFN